MSKPWSQAGIEAEWSEWRALFRNYAIGIAIVAALLWGAGFQCARVHYTRPDPAITGEQRHARALRDSLRAEKVLNDSLDVVIAVGRAHLAVDEAKAAQLHVAAAALSDSLKIDTLAHIITALDSAAAPADTVAYADVQRPNDERHYAIPRFFAQAYMAKAQEADAWHQVAETQHALVETYQDRVGRDSTTLALNDSLNASLKSQVDALNRRHAPWCGAKCGSALTLAALTAAAIALHEVRR